MKNFLKITTLLLFCCCWTSMFAQLPCEDCLDLPFDIVCVLDDSGETVPFPNACWAECEGYTTDDFVDCGVIGNPNPEPCDCEFTFEPVCAEDDEGNVLSFPNACFAECEGYTEYTECDGNPFPTPCPECEDEPLDLVCVETAPGIICTFPNLCYAECEGYTIDQVVECDSTITIPNDCDCDFEIEIVCVEVEEGLIVPFPNACWAECEGYTVDDFVDCDDIIIEPNDCNCILEFDPVCVAGDDGEIYPFPNACFAECEGYTADDFVDCGGENSPNLAGTYNYPTAEAEVLDKVNALNLIQNPVQNVLTMNFDLVDAKTTTLNINILSIGGEMKSSHIEQVVAGENQVQINVSDLKSGVYFLQVQTKTGVQTVKFIK